MEFSFFKGALWVLIRQMDWIATGILLGLFFLSVICVAIMVFKYITFRAHRQSLQHLLQRIRYTKNFNELSTIGAELQNTIGGRFIVKNVHELKDILEHQAQGQGLETTNKKLTTQDIDNLEMASNQILDTILLEEEAYLPILGTSASASPLIGLFGTIWGLIHAFVDISQEKSADIATVAPGMAEALIVTLAGLIVAIPALVAFHYFTNELRKIEAQLGTIQEIFVKLAQHAFVK